MTKMEQLMKEFGTDDFDAIIDQLKKHPEMMDDETRSGFKATRFLADTADTWMNFLPSMFVALICTMIHTYCKEYMIVEEKMIDRIKETFLK